MKSSVSSSSAAASGREQRRLAPRILDASSHSPANFPLFKKVKGIGRLKGKKAKKRDVLSSLKRPSTTADDKSRLSKTIKLEEKLESMVPRPQTVDMASGARGNNEIGNEGREAKLQRRGRPRLRPRTPNGTVQSIRELIGEVEEMKAAEVLRHAAGAFWSGVSSRKNGGGNAFSPGLVRGTATRSSRLPPLNDLQVTRDSGSLFVGEGETKEPVFSFYDRAKEVRLALSAAVLSHVLNFTFTFVV